MLDAFHKIGITKCDSFILVNTKLDDYHTYFVNNLNKNTNDNNNDVKQATITTTYGKINDSVLNYDSYIETKDGCRLETLIMINKPGLCGETFASRVWNWRVVSQALGGEYTQYEGVNGSELITQELSIGSLRWCVSELRVTYYGPHSH